MSVSRTVRMPPASSADKTNVAPADAGMLLGAKPLAAARPPEQEANFQHVRSKLYAALRDRGCSVFFPHSIGHYALVPDGRNDHDFNLKDFEPASDSDWSQSLFEASGVNEHMLRQLVWYSLEKLGVVDLYRQHRKELIDDRPRGPYAAVVYYPARNPADPQHLDVHVDADGNSLGAAIHYNNAEPIPGPDILLNAPEMKTIIDVAEKHFPPLLIDLMRKASETSLADESFFAKTTIEPHGSIFFLTAPHATPSPTSRALSVSMLEQRLEEFIREQGPEAHAAFNLAPAVADARSRGEIKIYKDEFVKAGVPEALCDKLWTYFGASAMDKVHVTGGLTIPLGDREKRLVRERSKELEPHAGPVSEATPFRDFIAVLLFP
jgi:hypothetical protein